MPVDTARWHAEIESFNGCSLHLIVKLHLNLLYLSFYSIFFLVAFCTIAITVRYVKKFPVFSFLTRLFLCFFLPFLSTSISDTAMLVISVSSFFPKNLLLTTGTNLHLFMLCILRISCTYFYSNKEILKPIPDLQKKKIKFSLVVIGMLTS